MSAIRRLFTESEYRAVYAALPSRLKSIMDSIEYVRENCWNCTHYDGFEGMPGKCLLHDCDIPNDERGKKQECFEQRIMPF